MPGEFFRIQQNPDITEAAASKDRRAARTLSKALAPTQRVAILSHHLDAPGPHAEGLSAHDPESAEEQHEA